MTILAGAKMVAVFSAGIIGVWFAGNILGFAIHELVPSLPEESARQAGFATVLLGGMWTLTVGRIVLAPVERKVISARMVIAVPEKPSGSETTNAGKALSP